mmetsp:Transcript_19333/g.49186  ORF Transcript_19333/g.49186 Transcript_19333/m.49186 type:complete len:145 (+) Transcript_19333:150-584(+)
MAAAAENPANKELRRLQKIEEHVVTAVEVAAAAVEEMSKLGQGMDKALATQLCQDFLAHMKEAQVLVQEAVASPASDRGFEATAYHFMARAHVASEKIGVVAMGLEAMRQAAAGAGAEGAALPAQQPAAALANGGEDAIGEELI